MTAVVAIAAISVWMPGCEDTTGEPTTVGGIQYEVTEGAGVYGGSLLTISPDLNATYKGTWPSESTWTGSGIQSALENATELRIIGDVKPITESYLFPSSVSFYRVDLRGWTNPDIEYSGSINTYQVIFPSTSCKISQDGIYNTNSDNNLGKNVDYENDMLISDKIQGQVFSWSFYILGFFPGKITATFDLDGGSWTDGSATKSVELIPMDALNLSGFAPIKDSCTLKGWIGQRTMYTDYPNDPIPYDLDAKPSIYYSTEFKAVWEEKDEGENSEEFTVTFDANGGDWTESKVKKCASGDILDLSTVTPPTRDSYTFTGWLCDDGKTYASTDKISVLSDMKFTAQWKAGGSSDPVDPVDPDKPATPVVPIFPGDEQEPIEVVTNDERDDSWLGQNGKTVILMAVVAAIIAELAVLSISKRR